MNRIVQYMEEQPAFYEIVGSIAHFIVTLNRHFPDENIIIAICCSAGEYRSVAVAEAVSKRISVPIKLNHPFKIK